MIKESSSYKWAKVKNGIPSVSIINIEITPSLENENKIIEYYSGSGFTSQGYIEEVPAIGYNDWKLGVKQGLEYAFSLVNSNWLIHINRLEGLHTDTNPSVVGYTAIRAFLDRIEFQLDDNKIEILEEFVFSSWQRPYKILIPDFFTLTFTEYVE
jgi:hypothetical protein